MTLRLNSILGIIDEKQKRIDHISTNMIIWGINAMNHDASICVVDSDTCEILFAGHAERYSRIKNDSELNWSLIDDALSYGYPQLVVWHENPWGRKARYVRSGQWKLLLEQSPAKYLQQFDITCPIKYSNHHASHAAGGFYTSGWDCATIVVVDAIGEMSTASIWHANHSVMQQKWSLKYPHSLGLFYSAITELVGLKPNEEEYILMGMAAYGEVNDYLLDYFNLKFFKDYGIKQKFNFHRGIVKDDYLNNFMQHPDSVFDIAATAQYIITIQLEDIMHSALEMTDCSRLVYSGGVALNCVANSEISYMFDKTWIMPNPGDAGNSLGAIANYLRKPLKWKGAMLGHNIDRPLDIDGVINELLTAGICGVANGRAEFGPRAFGNRSLLADPRRADIKDKVNEIKRRQKFRPFAPAVLERYAKDHFEFSARIENSKYMQYVANVLQPQAYPAITHSDGTARVQTVGSEAAILEKILERWYFETGCPILLNTSLNIKGEPLVNTWDDAKRWQQTYGVRVF